MRIVVLCLALVLSARAFAAASEGNVPIAPIVNSGYLVVAGGLTKTGHVMFCDRGDVRGQGECWERGLTAGKKVGVAARISLQELLDKTLKDEAGGALKARFVGVSPVTGQIREDVKVGSARWGAWLFSRACHWCTTRW